MALKPCRECKKEVADTAKTCPHCGVTNPAASAGAIVMGAVSMVVVLSALGWYFFGGGFDQQVSKGMDDIYAKVSQDAVDQYRITAQSGGAMDRCVQAGMVTAAFLQEKNDAQYARWKETEKRDC